MVPPNEYKATRKTFVVNNLQISGLKTENTLKLFMRDEAVALWNCLEANANKYKIFVQGCPGVGKSVIVFAHTMHFCWTQNKSLLYYHKDVAVARCFVMCRNHVVRAIEGDIVTFVVTNRKNYDITVIDGTHKEDDLERMYINFPDDKSLILCTSYQALKLNQEALYQLHSRNFVQWEVTSWTLQDYLQAALADCFPFLKINNDEERERLVEFRFRICGGSIGLFSGDIDKAKHHILDALSRIEDYKALYVVSDNAKDAVNRVIALYRTTDNKINSIPLSQFVFEEVSKRCETEQDILAFINVARNTLPNNSTWQGWVTEYEVASTQHLQPTNWYQKRAAKRLEEPAIKKQRKK